ncbi:hypothetical protein WG66_006469 [Moniliophthora roreri]|nr:hypothetical protein WG66_006469 [Moniliophthora roreri]
MSPFVSTGFNNHDIRILLLPFPSLSRHQPGLSKQSANSVMLDFTPAQYHYLQILIGLTHVITPRLYQWKRLTWGKVCLFLFLVDCWAVIDRNRNEKFNITLKYAFLVEKSKTTRRGKEDAIGNVVAVAVLAGIEMAQVTLNALVLYRVSSGASSYSVNHPTIPEINVTKSSTAVKTRWSPMNKIDQVGTVNTYRDGAIERRHSV